MRMKLAARLILRSVIALGCLALVQPAAFCPANAADEQAQKAPSPAAQTSTPGAGPPELTLEERGDIFMARKQYADAIDYYFRALKLPGAPQEILWNKIGIAHQQETNYRAARKAYQEAIRRKLDYAEPWNNLGTTFYLQNKARKSVKYFVHALTLQPNSAAFHLNLGMAYYRQRHYKEAVEQYRTALTLDPEILKEHGRTGTVMETREADVGFYYYLAKVFASLGRTEEAVRYLRHAFEDGFKDTGQLAKDPDFQKISKDPLYVNLIKNPPAPIKD